MCDVDRIGSLVEETTKTFLACNGISVREEMINVEANCERNQTLPGYLITTGTREPVVYSLKYTGAIVSKILAKRPATKASPTY